MKKVAVFGKPGGGKSTLAKTLSEITGLPLFQLDNIEYSEGGIRVAEEVYIQRPKKLHLIDPWEFQSEFPDRMYGGDVAKNQLDMDNIYEGVRKRFENNPNVFIHRGKSEQVLQEFEDAYFDWIYVDGNHYYEYVLKDLRLCLSKVKPGGIIAGDDYKWSEKEGFPVKRAVQDFVKENDLEENLQILGSQFIIKL